MKRYKIYEFYLIYNLMRYIIKFDEYLIEKTIGSEAIRDKWYSDLDKKTFYKLVNIDPTSVRKKDFSKPGKYTKWLIKMYNNINKDGYNYDFDSYFDDELNYKLFVFSTGWYKSKAKKENLEKDILKFRSLRGFRDYMTNYVDKFKEETEDAKFDVVFDDDNISILIPINFTASRETAKNTQWCTQTYRAYSVWNKEALLFRIIPKDDKYDKLKLTWSKDNKTWYIACSKYPEIYGSGNPFDKVGLFKRRERWEDSLSELLNSKTSSDKPRKVSGYIKETMSLLSDEAKKSIISYYNKFGVNN